MNRAPLTNNPAKLPKKLFGKQKIENLNFNRKLYNF